jgi:hypothetical protein
MDVTRLEETCTWETTTTGGTSSFGTQTRGRTPVAHYTK